MSADALPSLEEPVGLFPLPNAVLFPGATLPLQIYEARYRAMVRDALEGDRLIAMAVLMAGYEGLYHTNLAKISPIVCVGRIREHVQVPDGRYFLNLLGLRRARVQSEDRDGQYRLAQLEWIAAAHNPLTEGLESDVRGAFERLITATHLSQIDGVDRCRQVLNHQRPLEEVVDTLAATLLPQPAIDIRQRLLEELDVLERADILLKELHRLDQLLARQADSQDRGRDYGSMN